jgi:hypothetical protein
MEFLKQGMGVREIAASAQSGGGIGIPLGERVETRRERQA